MPIPTDAWVQIGAASTPVFSKDGTRLFHLRGAGLPQVWVMDVDGGNARQLSQHDEKVGTLRRSPTDDRLIWSIDAGGDELHQFWLLEPGGTPRPLTTNATVMHNFGGFSPDGTRIAYSANDRDPQFFDAVVMDLATGGTIRLHHGPCVISVAAWSPDGTRLAIIEDHGGIDQHLILLTVATGAAHEVPRSRPTRYQALRWTAAGDLMAITDAPDADFLQLCRIDEATGTATPVFAPLFREVEAWSLAPDAKTLATIENDRGYATLRVGALGTNRPAVTGLPEGIVAEMAWLPDSSALACAAQSPTNPVSLFLVRNAVATHIAVPDALAPAALTPDKLVAPHLIEWISFDGTRIPAFYALPKTPAPPGGYPAIMWIPRRPLQPDPRQFPRGHPDAAGPGLRCPPAQHARLHRLRPRLHGSRRTSPARALHRRHGRRPRLARRSAQQSTPPASASWASPTAAGLSTPPSPCNPNSGKPLSTTTASATS